MTLNQLQYFYQAAKTQHFNRAAENLSISQPSLSRAISSLENELGVMLFERVGRNVTLTKAGLLFLEHTERILDNINVAERKMHQIACSGGEISVAYVSPLATQFIPRVVHSFMKEDENKDISFRFYQGISFQNIQGLKSGRYDVIFGTRDVSEMSIRFLPVLHQKMVVILPEGHELAEESAIDPSVFNKYPVLTYDQFSGLGKYSQNFFRRHGLHPSIICESPDENGITSLVEEGFGIALVADVDYIHRPGICIRPLTGKEEYLHTVYMGYLAGKYQIPAVSRFIKFLQDHPSRVQTPAAHDF
ncbi:MAG: LysR family transcriptional regulator [Eubacteriales bacterium]|nr:LysR family transcriptional regulator [Eubacteriales bacterium]